MSGGVAPIDRSRSVRPTGQQAHQQHGERERGEIRSHQGSARPAKVKSRFLRITRTTNESIVSASAAAKTNMSVNGTYSGLHPT